MGVEMASRYQSPDTSRAYSVPFGRKLDPCPLDLAVKY